MKCLTTPIYLDNAATTPMYPEVVELMKETMLHNFGNPSSVHQFGRKAKVSVETVRKNIANYFNVNASEIVFTSGGTESDNLILHNAVLNLGVQRIITSKIEHHAVLHTVQFLQKTHNITVEYVAVDAFGAVDLKHLETLLSDISEKTLVSLMMVNNEIGNLLPIEEVSNFCQKYNSLFHSDTVQAIGHYRIDLQAIPVDFIVASAHKFHGPKGVGFAYVKKGLKMNPLLHGGSQERGIRSGTENVHAILGMGKALEIAYTDLNEKETHQKQLKQYFIEELQKMNSDIRFNGLSSNLEKSAYTILNVRFPVKNSMFLFHLDMAGIAVSGGSACQSGALKKSFVLSHILHEDELEKTSVRFSFSRMTNKSELEKVVTVLKAMV